MPQIGPMEILVVGVIALIVFGPQKLPEIARSIGRAASELRRMATDVRDEFEAGINLEDREESKEEEEEEEEEEAEAGDQAPEADEAATSTAPQTNKVVGPAPEVDEAAPSTAAQTNKAVSPAPTDDDHPEG